MTAKYQIIGLPPFTVNLTPHISSQILVSTFRRIMLVMGLWACSSIAIAEQFGDFRYGVAGSNIQIYEYTGLGGDVVIPEEIEGMPVTTIARYAFRNITSLTAVSIPTNVTAIFNNAFSGCTGLTTVSLSATLDDLRDGAFTQCTGLTNITVSPDNPGLSSSNGILYNKTGTTLIQFPGGIGGSITIVEGVTCIGYSAFLGSIALTNVLFPDTLTEIGTSAFSGCNGLVNVFIPAGVSNLASGAFANCAALTSIQVAESNTVYSSSNGILFDATQTTLVQYPAGLTGSYTLPGIVTNIGHSAFSGCAGLTAVTLPDSIATIGPYAFPRCAGLTTVTLPDSISSIEGGTFSSCSGLTNIVLNAGITNIGGHALFGCNALESLHIPDSVTRLGWGAFQGCTSLTNIVLGEGITTIESKVFYECNNLQNLYLPESVTDLWNQAFGYCLRLTHITVATNNPTYSSVDGVVFDKDQYSLLHFPAGRNGRYIVPDGTQLIGDHAFDTCGDLTCVELPADSIILGRYAFAHCTNLAGLCFSGSPPSLDTRSFWFTDNVVMYYLAENAAEWDTTFADRPTAIWPEFSAAGIQPAGFVFDMAASDNQEVVIEMCPDLSAEEWTPVSTQTVSGSSLEVTVPDWATDPSRFYRVTAQ